MDPRFDCDPAHPVEPSLQAELRQDSMEVQHLAEEIRVLDARRRDLLSRRNEILSTINILPPELLSLIFELACPPRKQSTGANSKDNFTQYQHPLRLGAVSSYWREVAWSIPHLWTQISPFPSKELPRPIDLGSINKDIIATYCRNSRSLPIDLHLNFRSFSTKSKASFEDASRIFRTLLVRSARRIRSLVCAVNGADTAGVWSLLTSDFMNSEELCNLGEVHFSESTSSSQPFSAPLFAHVPQNLRRVTLHRHPWSLHENFWGLLTSLELNSLFTTQCLRIVVQCTNLVEFKAFSRSTGPTITLIPPEEPITFENLQRWTGHFLVNEPINFFIYSSFRLPAVKLLDLGESSDPIPSADEEIADWEEFFGSMTNLKEIRSSYWGCQVDNWAAIWDIVGSSVQELEMSFLEPSQALAFINLLTPTSNQLSDEQLPSLKALRAALCLNSDRMSRFLDMVEMRRKDHIRTTNLEVAAPFENIVLHLCSHRRVVHPEKCCKRFTKAHRERIEQLIRDGLTFEINEWCEMGKEWVTLEW
ncbi:hypothetical protein AGABI2DRAFT_179729 [Agaricus bisporus var. bisporus H97]|uniref:hypothetical protein n=1 Tax=Agaricus bisporus var. bisporus (strain H97 / ATCC MYA-4626 / FGSC 10389) TaxID=936046 RepID=UPI00029F6470|nr:hypothetical protein AGABI2DRAFT_179729 [Agaricus bisporus var. bisporus H97]EKV45206.1 hypothetical protein AGABI2DRAFT_179729 [Agaricus bisporus var. bisporus H97]